MAYFRRAPTVFLFFLLLPLFFWRYEFCLKRHKSPAWGGSAYQQWLLFPQCHGRLRGVWEAVSVSSFQKTGTGGRISGKDRWRGRLRICAVEYEGIWKKSHGVVQGEGRGEPPAAGCLWEGEGALVFAQDGTSYGQYLFSCGIVHRFSVQRGKRMADGNEPGLPWLDGCRQWLRRRLFEGMHSKDAMGIYGAMVMGERQGLSAEAKDIFLKSASIHVFTVSGLHVSILAGGLLFLAQLCGISLRFRWIPVLPLLFFYIAVTGIAPSSLRAVGMVSFSMGALWLWRDTAYENQLAWMALVLLCFCPGWIGHLGFQFSFVLVFFLLRAAETVRQWEMQWSERHLWIPEEKRTLCPPFPKHRNFRRVVRWLREAAGWGVHRFAQVFRSAVKNTWRRVRGLLFTAWVAWLAGIGLMISCNQLFSWSAMGVNFLLPVSASFLIGLAIPKLLLSLFLPFASLWMGHFLERGVQLLYFLARAGAGSWGYRSLPVCSPGILWGYYLLLAAAFCRALPLRIRHIAWLSLFCLLGFLAWQRPMPEGVLSAEDLTGGKRAVAEYREGILQVVPGSYGASRELWQQLKQRGLVDAPVFLSLETDGDIGGGRYFLQTGNVRGMQFSGERTSRSLQKLRKEAEMQGVHPWSPEKMDRFIPQESR